MGQDLVTRAVPSATVDALYHVGFSADDLDAGTRIALLSGDPERSEHIATAHLADGRVLARNRGLDAFAARLPSGVPVVCATSGMGAPSASIVVNELVQAGIHTIIRIGTTGSIQADLPVGTVVIASAALCEHGAALDIAPDRYPSVADPFLTVALPEAATGLGVDHRVGIVASVDTFYEGQERAESSANPHLVRRLVGKIDEYEHLRVLSFEMEAGTLFTMGSVYGVRTGAVLAVVAQRHEAEAPDLSAKGAAVDAAIRVAIDAAVASA